MPIIANWVIDGRTEKIVLLKKSQGARKNQETLRFEHKNLGKTCSAITIQTEVIVRL
jgi:hypothetical protein